MKKIKYFGLLLSLAVVLVFAFSCKVEVEPTHEHTFSETWESDEINHWHKATCEHTEEVSDKAEHISDEGSVTKAATCTADGVKTYTCTVCKKTKTEAIAKTDHVWESGIVTTAATCLAEGIQTFTCTVCKETKTEAIEKSGHAWDNGTVITAATCTTDGVMSYTCTVCKETKKETISGGHSFSSIWSKDETNHWHVATCEHTTEVSGKAEHTWGYKYDEVPAKDLVDGSYKQKCRVCDYVKTVTVKSEETDSYWKSELELTDEYLPTVDETESNGIRINYKIPRHGTNNISFNVFVNGKYIFNGRCYPSETEYSFFYPYVDAGKKYTVILQFKNDSVDGNGYTSQSDLGWKKIEVTPKGGLGEVEMVKKAYITIDQQGNIKVTAPVFTNERKSLDYRIEIEMFSGTSWDQPNGAWQWVSWYDISVEDFDKVNNIYTARYPYIDSDISFIHYYPYVSYTDSKGVSRTYRWDTTTKEGINLSKSEWKPISFELFDKYANTVWETTSEDTKSYEGNVYNLTCVETVEIQTGRNFKVTEKTIIQRKDKADITEAFKQAFESAYSSKEKSYPDAKTAIVIDYYSSNFNTEFSENDLSNYEVFEKAGIAQFMGDFYLKKK